VAEFGFNLNAPCPDCPFRSDIRPYLRRTRAEQIVRDLERMTFACHETVHCPQPRDKRGRFDHRMQHHCAGALILMHKSDRQGDLQQVAERLGLYDRGELRMDAPVYDTFEQMIEAHND
jgi:hypothetical protein